MYPKDVLPRLDAFLAAGKRKIGDWLQTLNVSEVVFDDARAFTNINTQQELQLLGQAQPK
jgi:molybdopterin-guanine dinucleotide biosynthesis protein A